MSEKRLVSNFLPAGGAFDALANFETVTYTGNGGTQKITGYIRKGAAFNGSSSYIQVNSLPEDSTFSLSFWMNATDPNSDSTLFHFQASGNHIAANTIGIAASGTRFGWFPHTSTGGAGFTSISASDTNALFDGNWHNVVIVSDADSFSNSKLYIDGSEKTLTIENSYTTSIKMEGTLYVGKRQDGANDYNGKIDQIRIFNKALSSSEVTTLYGETYSSSTKSTTDIFGDDSGVALYELDEDANSSNFGQAASFNGSSSNIQNSSLPTVFSSANTISVSAWINTSHTGSDGEVIWSFSDNTAASTELACQVRNSKIQCFNRINGSHSAGPNFFTSITVADGNWHHIAYVASSSGTKFYIDGVEDTNRSFQDSTDANDVVAFTNMNVFSFGGNDDSKSGLESLYSGKIDQVRIYSSALDSDDVAELYAESADVPTANLVAHYKLDGNAKDETDTYDGTASNVTYSTGVYGGTPTNVNFLGMAFQPDFIWFKNRDDTDYNTLYDSIRGAGNFLSSNTTASEVGNSGDLLSSFDSNGFTVNNTLLGGSNTSTNGNNEDFVAWCWKAGGTAVSNTDGTITSQVSANTEAGFSIVEYTGNGGSATLGHGLSQQVEMVITKSTESTSQWMIYHKDLTGNVSGDNPYNLYFGTDAELDLTAFGAYNSFTSTVFPVTRQSAATAHNNNNNIDYIAYCFHSVDGYQKVGSYTGTGSSGNSVTTGFQPRFVLIKRTDTSGSGWGVFDSVRGGNLMLRANVSDAEADGNNSVSFVSNGFTLPETGVTTNTSGGTYIYLAIA